MDHIFFYYLIRAITTWKTFKQPPNPELIQIQLNDTLFEDQSKTGWNHAIYSQLITAWVDIQNPYDHSQDDGISIILFMLGKIVYKLVYHIWKERCAFKYRKIDHPVYSANMIEPKVQELCNKYNMNSIQCDDYIYLTDAPCLSSEDTAYMHQWIKKTDEIIQQSEVG